MNQFYQSFPFAFTSLSSPSTFQLNKSFSSGIITPITTISPTTHTLYCRARSPRSKKSKRPRSTPSSSENDQKPKTITNPDLSVSPIQSTDINNKTQSNNSNSTPDLSKKDSNGISLETRLREEILHPLRKPRQTLFFTLGFSATIGLLVAIGRYLTKQDVFSTAAINVGIDISAMIIFYGLAWRDVEFGRRSINSLAKKTQLRDLPVLLLPTTSNSKPKLISRLLSDDILLIVGKATDITKYLERQDESDIQPSNLKIIVFPTDAVDINASETFESVNGVAGGDVNATQDWRSWLAEAIPPRRNVALFRINKNDGGTNSPGEYVIAAGEPDMLPLPRDAFRSQVVDV